MYNLSIILASMVAIAVAISVHEFGHAYSAHLLGDDTAKMYGRMTLNPAKHLDIMGLIAMLIVHIGWAKPVPVNPNNFKNYKVGNVIVSLAGVTANIITAIICVLINKSVNMFAINLIAQYVIVYNEVAYKYESMSSIIFLVLIITGAYSIFVSPIRNVIWDILYLFM